MNESKKESASQKSSEIRNNQQKNLKCGHTRTSSRNIASITTNCYELQEQQIVSRRVNNA